MTGTRWLLEAASPSPVRSVRTSLNQSPDEAVLPSPPREAAAWTRPPLHARLSVDPGERTFRPGVCAHVSGEARSRPPCKKRKAAVSPSAAPFFWCRDCGRRSRHTPALPRPRAPRWENVELEGIQYSRITPATRRKGAARELLLTGEARGCRLAQSRGLSSRMPCMQCQGRT